MAYTVKDIVWVEQFYGFKIKGTTIKIYINAQGDHMWYCVKAGRNNEFGKTFHAQKTNEADCKAKKWQAVRYMVDLWNSGKWDSISW